MAGMIPTTYPGYHEASVQYAEDQEKARAYLAEAGYPDGQGLEAYPDALRITYIAEKESALAHGDRAADGAPRRRHPDGARSHPADPVRRARAGQEGHARSGSPTT